MAISSIISIDLVVAFVLVVLVFYVSAQAMAAESHSLAARMDAQAEVASRIARSYEIVSSLSEGRDNEITLSRTVSMAPKNVSLRTSLGYLYGGPSQGTCIVRAVYVRDIGMPAVLEVCQ